MVCKMFNPSIIIAPLPIIRATNNHLSTRKVPIFTYLIGKIDVKERFFFTWLFVEFL